MVAAALAERRSFARELDAALHGASADEARCREVLGRLAGGFLRRGAHHELGFARLRDYCRERLGISARELETFAGVATKLEGLENTRAAFRRGELSWTHVRLLTATAAPNTEAYWLTVAVRSTVRELEAHLRAHRDAQTPGAAAAFAECGEAGPLIENEAAVRFRLACPGHLRVRWRHAVELARRVAGEPLPTWAAAEAIAAEGSTDPVAFEGEGTRNRRARHLADARRDDGASDSSRTIANSNDVVSDACSSPPELESSDGCTVPPDPTASACTAADGGSPARLDGGAASHEDLLDAFTLDARLREVAHAMRRIDARSSSFLATMLDRRLYRLLGFESAAHYVRERLGFSLRKAQALCALERACWRTSKFAEAFRNGDLSWVRALTILPVVGRGDADDWVERAGSVTVRRLSEEVDWTLGVRDAFGAAAAAGPPTPDPLPSTGEILTSLAQMRAHDAPAGNASTLETRCARGGHMQMRALVPMTLHESGLRSDVAASVRDGEIRFTGPASVVALFRAIVRRYDRPGFPRWTALDRLLAHVIAEWERLPRHRDPIFARDGWRCAVPACSARRSLQDHHLRFRSRGGGNEQTNRVAVCATHHIHGLHLNYIRAGGAAPHAIRWELGLRRDRPPLLTLIGDRYVTT